MRVLQTQGGNTEVGGTYVYHLLLDCEGCTYVLYFFQLKVTHSSVALLCFAVEDKT